MFILMSEALSAFCCPEPRDGPAPADGVHGLGGDALDKPGASPACALRLQVPTTPPPALPGLGLGHRISWTKPVFPRLPKPSSGREASFSRGPPMASALPALSVSAAITVLTEVCLGHTFLVMGEPGAP